MIQYVHQPFGEKRLGEILVENLSSGKWDSFRAAIAFARNTGVRHVADTLSRFSRKNRTLLTVGIDLQGTSIQALESLLAAVRPLGKIWIYHNPISSTFHPKVYLFESESSALAIVGSGNLTEGGLYTNTEASLCCYLDLARDTDKRIHRSIVESLDIWSTDAKQNGLRLSRASLKRLLKNGYLADETTRPTESAAEGKEAAGKRTIPKVFLFKPRGVPPAPIVSKRTKAGSATAVTITTSPHASSDVYLMTLQKTDVGVGQITRGASRRSPEVFIPLAARDANPRFWGWPEDFVEDISKPGKLDRVGVKMRIGTSTVSVNMMTWPDKSDFRLRSEALRSSGEIGDIVKIEKMKGGSAHQYSVEIIPPASPLFPLYAEICSNPVRKPSKKLWGYY